jgi:hypothetical protein
MRLKESKTMLKKRDSPKKLRIRRRLMKKQGIRSKERRRKLKRRKKPLDCVQIKKNSMSNRFNLLRQ